MRIIHNTSFIINEDIEEEWIHFIKEHYLSVLHKNALCYDTIFTKVSIDQPEGKTYSLQIVFDSIDQQTCFIENWLPEMENQIIQHFANQYVCFSSVLTEI